MAHSMPTFLVGAEEQREQLESFKRRWWHFKETYEKSKPLCFSARAYQKSHPEKKSQGLEDADATLASPMILGAADGVSQVEDLGLDASLLPKELLKKCEELATSKLAVDPDSLHKDQDSNYHGPISLLKRAYKDTDAIGSTSVILAVMDNTSRINGKLQPFIGIVTLGDCEMVLLRRSSWQDPLQVVLHTEMQRIGGHNQTPLQLLRMSPTYDPNFDESDAIDTIERGSGVHCMSTFEGDVLIMGSDGVFDNLFLDEVVHICNERLKAPSREQAHFVPTHSAVLGEIAHKIVEKAHEKAAKCPHKLQAYTPVGLGGKADDTSVVVAEVVEWTHARREVWERSRSPPKWHGFFACMSSCQDDASDSEEEEDDMPRVEESWSKETISGPCCCRLLL